MRFLLTVLVVLTAAGASAQPVAPGARLDGIAAVVGEQVVLYSEVDALVQQSTQPGRAVPPDLWSRALDRLVDQRVVIARARQDTTITVTEDMLSSQVDRQVASLAAQMGGEEGLVAAYGRPVDEIRASFREDVRDETLLQIFRQRRLQAVAITPGEVRDWFAKIPVAERPLIPELVRVAHVVRLPASDDAGKLAVRTFLNALRDSVTAGQATFEELANRHSTDPGNANRNGAKNGGLYTTLRLSDLEARFRAAAAAAEIGAISPVFETPFGYHVMRVNERNGEQISFNHILLQVQPGEAEQQAALEFLSVLRDSVTTHKVPFEAIARRHSQDAESAQRGGFVSVPQTGQRDLQLDGLSSTWKATLDSMTVGDVSEPTAVDLLDGTPALHFVLLQKRTLPHTLAIEDDYSLLSQYALQEKQTEVLGEWVQDLRRTVYVDIRAREYQPAAGRPASGS